jgi:hypothetical protein
MISIYSSLICFQLSIKPEIKHYHSHFDYHFDVVRDPPDALREFHYVKYISEQSILSTFFTHGNGRSSIGRAHNNAMKATIA